MAGLIGLGVLLCGWRCGSASEEGHNTSWQGWAVTTSEQWAMESPMKPAFPMRHPLTYLFDDDPATAWVYVDRRQPAGATRRNHPHKPHRSVELIPDKPVTIDRLWLMNGYNKRRDLFYRNDRVVQIEIWVNHKQVKTANLADAMGWHRVSLPRCQVGDLDIHLTGIRKGSGRDNDVCLSELALYDGSRKINMHLPRVVSFSVPACCGAGDVFEITREGRLLATGGYGEDLTTAVHPTKRYVAGIESGTTQVFLWVIDVVRGRVIARKALGPVYVATVRWKDNQTCEVRVWDEHTGRTIHGREIRIGVK